MMISMGKSEKNISEDLLYCQSVHHDIWDRTEALDVSSQLLTVRAPCRLIYSESKYHTILYGSLLGQIKTLYQLPELSNLLQDNCEEWKVYVLPRGTCDYRRGLDW
jgi:hypothetical protein